MRVVISLNFCGIILVSVKANVPYIGWRLFEMVMQADVLSLLLFLYSGFLETMLGVKVGMEVMVEVVIWVT